MQGACQGTVLAYPVAVRSFAPPPSPLP
ncbi:MAG: hypothetical protein HW375_1001, partial [Anaerolineales bacterium]|nr:hypothetical protein [Anaerolineales bacterium]